MQYTGIIHNGVVVFDEAGCLPEGARVRLELAEPPAAPTLGQRLLKFAGQARDLPADMAAQHDHYLHGPPGHEACSGTPR